MFQFRPVYQPTFSSGQSGTSQDREQQPPFPWFVCDSCFVSQLGADLAANETHPSIDVVAACSCAQNYYEVDMIGFVETPFTAA
jgi:hypothetical protein